MKTSRPSKRRRQRIIANGSIDIDFKNVIDHGSHGVSHGFKICNGRLEKREGPLTTDTGQDNQTGVNVFGADERAKIARILGDNDKSTSDAPLKHTMVGGTTAPEIQRVLSNMLTARIQFAGYLSSTLYESGQVSACNGPLESSCAGRHEEFPPRHRRMSMLKNTRSPTHDAAPPPKRR